MSTCTMPIDNPPAKVSGRLLKPPRAAAPNAVTTRKVKVVASSGTSGAIRTPDAEASSA
jgi:hypothetical protein